MFSKILNSKATFVNFIATILGVLTFLFFVILGTDREESPAATYIFLILAILLGLGQLALTILRKGDDKDGLLKAIQSVLNVVQIGFYGLALCFFMIARVQWLFNLLSKMSAAPFTAMFPITCALFVITMIVQVVAGYMSYESSEKIEVKAE